MHKKILAENLMIGAQTLKERLRVKEEETKEKFLDPTLVKLLEDPIEKVYKLKAKEEKANYLINQIKQIIKREDKDEKVNQ